MAHPRKDYTLTPELRAKRKYLSVKETADEIGRSAAQVYKLIRNNEIPHTRIGGALMIPTDLLEQYLEANTNPGKLLVKKRTATELTENTLVVERERIAC